MVLNLRQGQFCEGLQTLKFDGALRVILCIELVQNVGQVRLADRDSLPASRVEVDSRKDSKRCNFDQRIEVGGVRFGL